MNVSLVKNNDFARFVSWAVLFATIIIWTSCTPVSYKEFKLSDHWQFRQADENTWRRASVPGTVHADLLNLGLIPDPFIGMNDTLVQWVEREDWEYKTHFRVPRSVRNMDAVKLKFAGLDTYADVFLNGHKILEASNMFIGYEVDVKDFLTGGRNELVVYFHSPVKRGLEKKNKVPYILQATSEQAPEEKRTSIFTRKAPFQYGWDWAPRLVTSGIWRPVTLKAWNQARIIYPYLATDSILNDTAFVTMDVMLDVISPGDYTLITSMNGIEKGRINLEGLEPGEHQVNQNIRIVEPELWWPNGLGEPALQDVEFILERVGRQIDTYSLEFGIRTVRLVQQPDTVGASFYFEVNGIPVFMKGANVIPPDPLLRPDKMEKTYRRIISDAVAANMNMLRVWGGGIYKDEIFYQLCDQNGLLVWQDFIFACAIQPGDEAHLENIRREAEYNVRRLRNHASLAIWCGNNENLTAWYRWGWRDLYTPEQAEFIWRTYERIFHEILPQAVATYDPKTAYHSSSPSSINNTVSDRRSGNEHDWTIWFAHAPLANYAQNLPRFVTEFGMQSIPEPETVAYFAGKEVTDIFSPIIDHRQRSRMDWHLPGYSSNNVIKFYAERYFPETESFDELAFVSRLVQAKGYKTSIEAHRRNMPHCMGSLYWQINDCWPTISWSTVDFFGNWKPSHYAVRNSNEAVIASPVLEDEHLKVYVVSDFLEKENANLMLTLIDMKGNILMQKDFDLIVLPNQSQIVFSENLSGITGTQTKEWALITRLTGEGIGHENILYPVKPREMALEPAPVRYRVIEETGVYKIELVSDKLIKGLSVESENDQVRFCDNYFDLLPGIPKIITTSLQNPGALQFKSLNSIRAGEAQQAIKSP